MAEQHDTDPESIDAAWAETLGALPGGWAFEVAQRFVDGNRIQEGALNRVSALVRAYDPCLSCSTHEVGPVPMVLQLVAPDGELIDEIATE